MAIAPKQAASEAPANGEVHDELSALLARHISQITVRSLMNQSLTNRLMTSRELDATNIVRYVEELMSGLRLFCDPANLPTLMLELAEFCDRVIHVPAAPPSLRSLMQPKPRSIR